MIKSSVKKIYLDYAATTPIDTRVAKAMRPYIAERFGNPGSLHGFGAAVKNALAKSRKTLADIIHAKQSEVIITSSATEANNLALKGAVWAAGGNKHVVVSAVEHACVLETVRWLATQGTAVSVVPVDRYGMVSPADVKKAIRKDTVVVSVMHANNEIGSINPIGEIGKICRGQGVLFHTDAAQTFGRLPIDVSRLNIDLLSASSHKIYGPKGVGLLYIRSGTRLEPLLHGGGQEFGLRSSSVNVAGAVGFAAAAQLLQQEAKRENARLMKLRDMLITGVLKTIPSTTLGGHPRQRLPHNAHFIFDDVNGEQLVLALDEQGIACATGSACLSLRDEASHVVSACGQNAEGALRVTLGRETTKTDIMYVLKILPGIVQKLCYPSKTSTPL